MTGQRDDDDEGYEVGYGKPPKGSRFKKGQSGNPKGRPKGAKSVKSSMKRELESKISVRQNGRTITISKSEAAAKRLVDMALQGDPKALLLLVKLDSELFEDAVKAVSDEQRLDAGPVDHEMLASYLAGGFGVADVPEAEDGAFGGMEEGPVDDDA